MKHEEEAAGIISVGTAVPAHSFTQEEIARLLQVHSAKGKRFFSHPHIAKRHLALSSSALSEANPRFETTEELLRRFKTAALQLSEAAARVCLQKVSFSFRDIGLICCVTSTGFIVPALSALLSQKLALSPACQRLDIVGMGCNAGLNGLSAVANWCKANPGQKALLICCEVCSAIYNTDDSEESALVNSLFGDGAAAVLLSHESVASGKNLSGHLLGFSSYLVPDSLELLRFDWDCENQRFSFVVDKKTPETIASRLDEPLRRLLESHHLGNGDIRHWVVHSGGEAILSALEKKLGLKPADLRHTRSVLKEYGNISSGSFLFSYLRLSQEGVVQDGDYGVMITMGPGLTVEMALLQWRVG